MLELRGLGRNDQPYGQGAQSQHTTASDSYTPIYLPSPLVRSCPRALGAQAPPTAAAAGLVTFWPWSHSCRAGELCTLDFQLSRALQRGPSECFVGSALCPPKLLQALPKPSTGQTQSTSSRLSLSCYPGVVQVPRTGAIPAKQRRKSLSREQD